MWQKLRPAVTRVRLISRGEKEECRQAARWCAPFRGAQRPGRANQKTPEWREPPD